MSIRFFSIPNITLELMTPDINNSNRNFCKCLGIIKVAATACILLSFVGQIIAKEKLEIRFDPSQYLGASADEVMDSVSYSLIKLNSSDTKIARVEKVRIEDDHIFIWDNVQEVIFIFSSSGDFVSKIEKLPGIKPRVPMENIRSFIIDEDRHFVIVEPGLFNNDTVYYRFIYDGKFNSILSKPPIDYANFIVKENGNYLYYQNPVKWARRSSEILYHLLEYDSLIHLVNHYDPMDTLKCFDRIYSYNDNIFTSSDKKSVFYTDYYSYEVSDILNCNNILTYKFILPLTYSIPTKFENNKCDKEFIAYFLEHGDVVHGFSDVYRVGNNLFFKAFTNSSERAPATNNFLFSLNGNNTLLSLYDIRPSDISHYMPLFGDYTGIVSTDNGFIYLFFA